MLVLSRVIVGGSARSLLAIKGVLILWGRGGRSVRSRGGYVHEEWVATPGRFTNELHSMITDSIGEVVCLVVIAMCFSHTLIGHSVAIESAKI